VYYRRLVVEAIVIAVTQPKFFAFIGFFLRQGRTLAERGYEENQSNAEMSH
jgi:hypothetical protein